MNEIFLKYKRKSFCVCLVHVLLMFPMISKSQCCLTTNLLSSYNPDFSAAITTVPPGFQSANTYVPISTGGGTYCIISNRNWGACATSNQYDHTTGTASGKYLWFDTPFSASLSNPAQVWIPYDPSRPAGMANLIDVQKNTDYVFSVWVRDIARNTDCTSGGAPLVGLQINGSLLTQLNLGTITTPCCPDWQQMCINWNSGNNTTAKLEILSMSSSGFTDLGVDDVFFGISAQDLNDDLLGNDTIVCGNTNLSFTLNIPGASYLWQNNTTSNSLSVNTSGKYWVEVSIGPCTSSDTINVTFVNPTPVNLGKDTSFCQGNQLLLDVTRPFASYIWQNGSISPIQTINSSGKYWVEINESGCLTSDTIEVTILDTIPGIEINDTIKCPENGVEVIIDPIFNNILWSNGNTSRYDTIYNPGKYWVKVENECGSNTDTFNVIDFKENPPFDALSDKKMCPGDKYIAPLAQGYDYKWDNGEASNQRTINNIGKINLTVTDLCFEYNYDANITFGICGCHVYVPSAFTPNNDDINSLFSVVGDCDIVTFEIHIFNRWGEEVFSSDSFSASWDGTSNGKDSPGGKYMYRMLYSYKVKNVIEAEKEIGFIYLMR